MEDREKKHINGNLSKLVDLTMWSTSCITVPKEQGVFGDDDIAALEAISNKRDRVLEFYQIFTKRKNSYKCLIAALEMGNQSGAIKILNELPQE